MQGIAVNERVKCYIYPVEYSQHIYVELLVRVGSSQDGRLKGIAHFLEHMLLGFDRVMNIASANYEHIWGNTSFISTSYKIQVRDGQESNLKDCLEILRNICLGKTLDENLWGIVFIDIFSSNKKEASLLSNLSCEKIYFPIGEKEYLFKFDYNKVLSFFRTFYSNSPIALIVTGNITFKNIEQLIKEVFDSVHFEKSLTRNNSAIVQSKGCYFCNYNSEQIFMIKRNMNDCSLENRVIEDISFIICEEIIERTYFDVLHKECDVYCKRILYDNERQFICIEVKCHDDIKVSPESWHNIGTELLKQSAKVVCREIFDNIKNEYSLSIEKNGQITPEQYIGEAEKNFLFGIDIFQKNLYLDYIKRADYQLVHYEVAKLIKDLSVMLRTT